MPGSASPVDGKAQADLLLADCLAGHGAQNAVGPRRRRSPWLRASAAAGSSDFAVETGFGAAPVEGPARRQGGVAR